MARFAVFEAAVAPVCAPSSFSSSQNLNSSRPHCSSPSPSPLPFSHSPLTTSERRISSNPSITSPKLSDSSSNNFNLVPTNRDTSMRTSHSDTNLIERFRRGSFMANLVGSRKSFTLQKRKSKKDKKQTTTSDNTSHRSSKEIVFSNDDQTTKLKRFVVLADVPPVPNNSAASDSQPSESVSLEVAPAPPPHTLPSSANDYLLHSHTFFQQQQQRENHQSDSISLNDSNDQKASNQVSSGSIKSKKSTSPTRMSKQHSSNSTSYELKKSWLYPMTFINCCLTRTDSLPDVCLDSNGNTQSSSIQPPNCNNEAQGSQLEQRLAQISNEENGGHVMGEQMFIQSLNELFFNTNRAVTPNPMISPNNGVQSQAEQERAIYLEEASEEAEWNSLHLSPSGRPTDEEQLHELRRLLHSHQHNQVYPAMSSFAQSDTDRFFSPSNYPLHLSRMFGSFANQTVQNGESGEARHLNPANQYSISNFNSVLPYPPPSLFRLQRHSRAHSNPVHTQIDYINCLVPDLRAISNCSFYWGKMDRYEAERLLEGKSEGTFLLRDSAQEDHLFSVSFRRFDRSLHARIEQWKHRFSFDSHDPGVYSSTTVTGLIEHYKDPSHCMFFEPMLTKPLNRKSVFTLQHLARATICDNMSYGTINDLPLPIMLKSYLKEYHYRQKVRTKHFDEFTYLSNYFQS